MLRNTPLISIVLVVKNGAPLIRAALDSIVAQNYPELELIVIDGDSKDETWDIVSEFKEFIAFRESRKDHGLYFAMNRGLQATTGELINVIGCDDRFTQGALESVAAKFVPNALQVIYGDMTYVDRSASKRDLRVASHRFPKIMIPHPTCFVSRNLLNMIGQFNTDFQVAADLDFMVRAKYSGASFVRVPRTLITSTSSGFSSQRANKFKSISDEYLIRLRYRIGSPGWTRARYALMFVLIGVQNLLSIIRAPLRTFLRRS